jgi:hypothetical protein
MQAKDGPAQERQELELFQAAELLLEECRMVLPGIQSLFGFQLIAVFSDGFHQRLADYEQDLHLLAITLIGVAIALIMTPAAVHRQLDACVVTRRFIALSARLLLWSMLPLALGLCLDFYLVARVISGSVEVLWLAVLLLVVFFALWGYLPRRLRRHLDQSARGS